jgi:hypothetical protein
VDLRKLEPLPEDHEINEEKKMALWENYFVEYGDGLCRINNKNFRSLVRRSVPDKLRGLKNEKYESNTHALSLSLK